MVSTSRWPLALAAAFLALSAWATAGHADNDAIRSELTPAETAHALRLIKQLGDADFHTRERATTGLKALGPRVAMLLREHAESPDLEVRMRIEFILEDMPSRVHVATRLTQAPELDGRIGEDPAWKGVPPQQGAFRQIKAAGAPAHQTAFRIGYTHDAIYLAVQCMEPQPKAIKADLKDGEALFNDDSIELFLRPPGSEHYFQLVASARGARWNGIGKRQEPQLRNWQAATRIGDESWTLEMKIPLAAIDAAPQDIRTPWHFNVCRNIRSTVNELCSWAEVKGSFHEPQNFALLVFERNGEAPPAGNDAPDAR